MYVCICICVMCVCRYVLCCVGMCVGICCIFVPPMCDEEVETWNGVYVWT